MEDENLANVEKFDILEPLKNSEINAQSTSENKENDTKDEEVEKKGWKFPTAYSILLIIQLLVFILTFIVPKGKYATILYDKKKEILLIHLQIQMKNHIHCQVNKKL